jgi:hypothetical protein
MVMALLAGGGATTISALGNCGVPCSPAVRLQLCRHSGLRRLSLSQPRCRLRIAARCYGGRATSVRRFVCRAAAAAATVESDATVTIPLPTIPSEATLAKV